MQAINLVYPSWKSLSCKTQIKAFIPIIITLSNVKKRISFVLSTLTLSNALIAILVVITIDVKAPSRHYCVFVWKGLFMRFRLSSTLQRSKTLTKTFCNVETSENASFWKRSGCSVDRWKRRFSKTMTSGRRKQLKTHECGSMKRRVLEMMTWKAWENFDIR